LTAEIILTLLPFIVDAIVLAYKGELKNIFLIPEWSIASSVLMAQALLKFISFVLAYDPERVDRGKALLVSAVLIVICLGASLVILSLVIFIDKPTRGLAIAQIVLFFFGIILFIHFGSAQKDRVS
jgi:hypothetical protein